MHKPGYEASIGPGYQLENCYLAGVSSECLQYSVYFPLGFANESNFKGVVLILHVRLVRGVASLEILARPRLRPMQHDFVLVKHP